VATGYPRARRRCCVGSPRWRVSWRPGYPRGRGEWGREEPFAERVSGAPGLVRFLRVIRVYAEWGRTRPPSTRRWGYPRTRSGDLRTQEGRVIRARAERSLSGGESVSLAGGYPRARGAGRFTPLSGHLHPGLSARAERGLSRAELDNSASGGDSRVCGVGEREWADPHGVIRARGAELAEYLRVLLARRVIRARAEAGSPRWRVSWCRVYPRACGVGLIGISPATGLSVRGCGASLSCLG